MRKKESHRHSAFLMKTPTTVHVLIFWVSTGISNFLCWPTLKLFKRKSWCFSWEWKHFDSYAVTNIKIDIHNDPQFCLPLTHITNIFFFNVTTFQSLFSTFFYTILSIWNSSIMILFFLSYFLCNSFILYTVFICTGRLIHIKE